MKRKHTLLLLLYIAGILAAAVWLTSCTKVDQVQCYKCYVNGLATPYERPAYDTCVVEGARAWRDDRFNCYPR